MKILLLAIILQLGFLFTAQARVWTTTAGEQFEGSYISANAGSVSIQLTGKSIRQIGCKQLSKADREFVNGRIVAAQLEAARRRALRSKAEQAEGLINQGSAALDEIIAQKEAEEADRKASVEAARGKFQKKMASKKKNSKKKKKSGKKGKKK